jgi:hypothetical protein
MTRRSTFLDLNLSAAAKPLPQRAARAPRPNNWAANDASIFRK